MAISLPLLEVFRRKSFMDFGFTITDFFVSSTRLVDERVSEEVESSLNTGIMKNNKTTLFHRQNRANQ